MSENLLKLIEEFFQKFLTKILTNEIECKTMLSRTAAAELYLLSLVHGFVTNNIKSSKRNIYYLNVSLFGSQSYLDYIIESVCKKIGVSRSQLNIEASNRSVIYGEILLSSSNEAIDCLSSSDGISLPSDFKILNSSLKYIKFILVIEKDATFQFLVKQGFCELFRPCILLTSKGFPDFNSRTLLSNAQCGYKDIPVFCLVDADPYGLSIYYTYKYGSKKVSLRDSNQQILQCKSMKLLGLLATDLEQLQFKKSELLLFSESDIKLLNELKSRKYYEEDLEIKIQVECFLRLNYKAEIQSLDFLGARYLIYEYLYKKLINYGIVSSKIL